MSTEGERLAHAQNLGRAGKVHDLLAMLTDSSFVVRRGAVDSVARIGEPAIEPLVELLRTHRDNEARIAATVDALTLVRGQPRLALEKLADEAPPAVIADALQILGRRRVEESVPLLARLVKHEDDIVAVSAIEALGRIGGRASIAALIDTVHSGNFFRTFPAIDILGRSGDRRVIEPLTILLTNTIYLPEAARALGRTGDRAALFPLVSLLKSPTDSVARLGIVSLWDLRERFEERAGEGVNIIDELLKVEVHGPMIRRLARVMSGLDAAETRAACRLFGVIGSPEATEILTAKLDGLPEIAESAAAALKKIGREGDLQVLQALREGDSARRKVLLPLITRTAATEDVVRCLRDADPEVRALACESLARLGASSAVGEIFALFADPNLRVVHSAVAGLQSLGTRESRRLAAEGAKSVDPLIRRASLRVLAYFGDENALQPMVEALSDPDLRVREVALQGLPYLEDSRAALTLLEAARSPDDRLRALAVRSLGQLPKADDKTISVLLRALADPEAWVRYYACQSLGRLHYGPAASDLALLLHDEAGQVRVAAVEGLSHMDSPVAHQALQRAVHSSEADVKRAALLGLGLAHRMEDLPIVIEATRAADVSTRMIALSALVSFRSELVVETLGAAAGDSDDQVRTTAIGFLAARSETRATEILVEHLVPELTREEARRALLVPQAGRANGLLEALRTASEELAPILIGILQRIPRPEAKINLLAAMKLDNVAARKAAATALAARLDPNKVAVLREAAATDADKGVRDICALLLTE